jgi:hypothetical protein
MISFQRQYAIEVPIIQTTFLKYHLEPDVAKIFKDSATVNAALRMLAKIAQEYVPTQAKG